MIERHVTFEVIPGKESDFEALFAARYSVAMAKQPGFVSVGLLRRQDQSSTYEMKIRFESLETAGGWRNSAEHKELSPVIKAMYTASSVIVFDVIA